MNPVNAMMSTLTLVYPPVSNQEAEWLKSDGAVKREISKSDFYVIAARAEAKFTLQEVTEDGHIHLTVSIGDSLHDEVVLDPNVFIPKGVETFEFRIGPKIIQFYSGTEEDIDSGNADLLNWFTTEKLIYDRSRGEAGIERFNRFREFGTYELLYVGIAKSTDTFKRLFEGAHHARQRILSNEWPRSANARTTDEMYLFPLKVEPIIFRSLGEEDDFTDVSSDAFSRHLKTIVIDAEKAFVHLLDPEYNIEKFASYPQGKDGLYRYGYERYGFILGENLTFTTSNATLRGEAFTGRNLHYDWADAILISGDEVEIRKAPDYPK